MARRKVKYDAFIGVDPGINGGVACIHSTGGVLYCEHTPTVKFKKKKALDVKELASLFTQVIEGVWCPRLLVMIEKVNAFPGGASHSMFTFGGAYFCVQGICAANEISYRLVLPRKWMQHFDLIGTPKKASLELARKMFPSVKLPYKTTDINRAEALLIAQYALDTH